MTEAGERLVLFEGIIMGIYGNWLISAVDKITFTQALFQLFFMISSFAFLILFVGSWIFRPRWLFRNRRVGRYNVAVFGAGHLIFIYLALLAEGFSFKNLFFFTIGAILFFIIYYIELRRLKRPATPHFGWV